MTNGAEYTQELRLDSNKEFTLIAPNCDSSELISLRSEWSSGSVASTDSRAGPSCQDLPEFCLVLCGNSTHSSETLLNGEFGGKSDTE